MLAQIEVSHLTENATYGVNDVTRLEVGLIELSDLKSLLR